MRRHSGASEGHGGRISMRVSDRSMPLHTSQPAADHGRLRQQAVGGAQRPKRRGMSSSAVAGDAEIQVEARLLVVNCDEGRGKRCGLPVTGETDQYLQQTEGSALGRRMIVKNFAIGLFGLEPETAGSIVIPFQRAQHWVVGAGGKQPGGLLVAAIGEQYVGADPLGVRKQRVAGWEDRSKRAGGHLIAGKK